MKTAIYIEKGDTQLVLTPENDWEKSVIRAIETGSKSVTIKRGSFYECQGGWNRMGAGEESLIMRTTMREVDDHGCDTTEEITS